MEPGDCPFSGFGKFFKAFPKMKFLLGAKIYEFVYVVNKEKFNESQYSHMTESIKLMD